MDTIKDYKCPCCSAPLVFDAEKQNMHCEFCGADISLEAFAQLDKADGDGMTSSSYDWEHYEPRSFDEGEAQGLSSYTCPSCGAEITGDGSMGSTICPYCGNSAIVKGQFEGTLRPDYVIPFKVDKKAAVAEFEKACKGAPFLPDEFKDKKRIEEMAGVYIPFWMFDCDCNADIRYSAQREKSWSDSSYEYTKTDYYRLVRSGSIGFQNIPSSASKKSDSSYTESVEPFDYGEAVNFNTAYLSGYLADKYEISAEESSERANERVKNSTESAFIGTSVGYSSVVPESSNISFSNGKVRYSLLPVWMLNIKYNGENYKFAINGQTGKTVGKFPIDKRKKWLYFGKVYAIGLAVCAIAAKLLGLL